jgi:hypothetical protein
MNIHTMGINGEEKMEAEQQQLGAKAIMHLILIQSIQPANTCAVGDG